MADIYSIDSLHTLVNSQFEERDLIKETKAVPTLSRTTLEVFRRALDHLAPNDREVQQKFRSLPNLQMDLNVLKTAQEPYKNIENESSLVYTKKLRTVTSVTAGVITLSWIVSSLMKVANWSHGAWLAVPALALVGAAHAQTAELEKGEQRRIEQFDRARQQARNSTTAFEAFFADKKIQSYLQGAISTKLRRAQADSIRAKTYLLAQEELKKCIDYCEVY